MMIFKRKKITNFITKYKFYNFHRKQYIHSFFSEAAQRIVVTGVNDIPTTIEKGNSMYFFL